MTIVKRQRTKSLKTKNSGGGKFSMILGKLGKIGKALLFPIATLPIAALLLRIGAQIPAGTAFGKFIQSILINGGNVLFDNLYIVFGIGVAFGLTKDNRGEAAMAGFIGIMLVKLLLSTGGADLPNQIYHGVNFDLATGADAKSQGFHRIFTTAGKDAYDAILASNVLNGIIAGGLVAFIYNKFNGIELPSALGFFSGRRLVPVLTILSILILGIVWAVIFPWIGYALYLFSQTLADATGNRYGNAAIMGVYGFLNRLLIPFGLHHIPNTLFWFTLPVFGSDGVQISDSLGNPVSGDIFAFLNGVPAHNTSGTFQSGFFPVMMFGLPALAAVFYVSADDKVQKQRVLAIFGSAALVSFTTGITEPIEFAFLYISPALFLTHAVLTGIFGFITGLFGIQLGFGFSAGLLDYAVSIPKSMDIIHANKSGIEAVMANPAWIFVLGPICAATYYFIGRYMVKKFNISTPGRGENKILADTVDKNSKNEKSVHLSAKAKNIVKGFGGWDNITSYQNCATRLRYDVKDSSKINESLLKRGGAIGVKKVSKTHVQAIIGPKVEILNDEIIAKKGSAL